MFVNTNSLRIRKIDGNVIWLKRGASIDEKLIPETILRKLLATDRLVEKMGDKQKKAPKAENKIMPDKASKKGASK